MNLERLSTMLTAHAETRGWIFSLNGNTLSLDQVFAPTGLLPALGKRAVQIANLCFSSQLGLSFPQASNTQTGCTTVLEEQANPVELILCLLDVLEELAKTGHNGKIALDELMYE